MSTWWLYSLKIQGAERYATFLMARGKVKAELNVLWEGLSLTLTILITGKYTTLVRCSTVGSAKEVLYL